MVFGSSNAGREGVHLVRRSRKPAKNAEQDKKSHLWMATSLSVKYQSKWIGTTGIVRRLRQ